MLKIFNAFQIVGSFAAWPFLIAWLQDATFKGVTACFYSACVLYVVAFGFMIAAVREAFDDGDNKQGAFMRLW